MTEKDHIKELFSDSLGQHSMPVRPEVWSGLQAKMAAAGMTSTATAAAAKGMSVLTKWIIGGTAAAVVGVTTTVLVMQSAADPAKTETAQAPKEQSIAPQEASTQVTNDQEPASATPLAGNTHQVTFSDQRLLPPVVQEMISVPVDGLLKPSYDPTAKLPDVKPTIVPANSDLPKIEFEHSDENKEQEVTPEEAIGELPETIVETKESQLIIPNVFTPDGDGINDEFFVTSANISGAEIIIQNTANKVVYSSNDIHFRWNGRINGVDDPVEPGMYACVIIYKDASGKLHKRAQILEVKKLR